MGYQIGDGAVWDWIHYHQWICLNGTLSEKVYLGYTFLRAQGVFFEYLDNLRLFHMFYTDFVQF